MALPALLAGGSRFLLTLAGNQGDCPLVEAPAGVQYVAVAERGQTENDVTYSTDRLRVGRTTPAWQNCGVYREPIVEENAVHPREHGAVWITYQPDLRRGGARDALDTR